MQHKRFPGVSLTEVNHDPFHPPSEPANPTLTHRRWLEHLVEQHRMHGHLVAVSGDPFAPVHANALGGAVRGGNAVNTMKRRPTNAA